MGNKISGTLFHSSVFVSRGFCSGRELPFPRALVGCHGGRRKPLVSRSGQLSLSEKGKRKDETKRKRERNEKKRVRKEKRKEDRKGGKDLGHSGNNVVVSLSLVLGGVPREGQMLSPSRPRKGRNAPG